MILISRVAPLLCLALAGNAQAAAIDAARDYPSRPIRLVVPVPPGGAIDTFAQNADPLP